MIDIHILGFRTSLVEEKSKATWSILAGDKSPETKARLEVYKDVINKFERLVEILYEKQHNEFLKKMEG